MRVVRMLAVRDEADILEANLRWYAERGISTVALDDGSTDGSEDLLRAAAAAGVVSRLERWESTAEHDWPAVIRQLQSMAAEEGPEVLMLTAADEFFEVGDGSDLLAAIEEDMEEGHTVLDFKNMEFHPTEDDDPRQPDPMLRMRHYAHREVGMQRGVRWAPGVDFAHHFGHHPLLPEGLPRRVSPRLYVSRHYPIRSTEQIRRKMSRIRPLPGKRTKSTHYLRLLYGGMELNVPTEVLHRYEDDHRWVLEQTSLPWRLRQTTQALAAAHLRVEQLESQLGQGGAGEGR